MGRLLQLRDLFPLEDVFFINDPVVMVVAEKPVGKFASLADCFKEVRQFIRSIGRVDFSHYTAGSAMGQDTVHRPVDPVQVCQGLLVFLRAGHLLSPPAHTLDPEHGPHPAHQPILALEIRSGGIEDAILNIVGGRAAHGKPGEAAEVEDLSPHKVQDMIPRRMDPPAVPLLFRKSVQQAKILMVPVHEQGGKGLFLQPVQPVLVFLASVPQASEIAIVLNSG